MANSYLSGFCGLMPSAVATLPRDHSQHQSPNTPLVDEAQSGYSPISISGEEGSSCSSSGQAHLTNAPGLFKPTPIPSGSPMKRNRPSHGTGPSSAGVTTQRHDVPDALAAMEGRIMAEFAALRTDVATLKLRVDGLSAAIEESSGNSHTYAQHLQRDLADAINHITSVLDGRREKMREASSILRNLLHGETPSAATSSSDAQ